MSKQIFQTDRCVLVAFEPGASGNFLLNALCFHSQFQPHTRGVFLDHSQQREFIRQQLDLQITNSTKEEWNHFNTSELDFYGVQGMAYRSQKFVDIPDSSISQHCQQILAQQGGHNIQRCIDQQRYFFKIVHRMTALDAYRRMWPHSQTILLVNAGRQQSSLEL
jgi:hypothetical protein